MYTVIDVGVAGSTLWLYNQFDTQGLIFIEPLNVVTSLSDMLNGRKYGIYECAAGARSGQIKINFDTTRPQLSSIYDRTKLTKRVGHQ